MLKWPALIATVLLVPFVLAGHAPLYGAEAPVSIPPPAVDSPKEPGATQTAVLTTSK
jgi:hypothetical protein